MKVLVTGAAGFIGSHLTEALLAEGYQVVALDNFDPYYPKNIKQRNLATAAEHPNFAFHELNLCQDNVQPALEGAEVIFHLAAQPGLLRSWSEFDSYLLNNVQATQRLLEAVKQAGSVKQFIYGSTSSIYGAEANGSEDTLPRPVSPYGITKLAAENLCQSYAHNFGLPLSILRFFSVYGPRQRPDMGYHLFIERIKNNQPIRVFGDGSQRRANTYVADIVRATILAHKLFRAGEVYNIGGSELNEVSAIESIRMVEEIIGRKAILEFAPARPGEQSRSVADTRKAAHLLHFQPEWDIRSGLQKQIEWQL